MEDAAFPLSGRWTLATAPARERSGELVLDPRNERLKLYGLNASECRDPAIAGWREGLRNCTDIYSKLIVYGRAGDEASWVTAGYLYEGAIAGFFADGADAHLWVAFGYDERSDAPRDAEHDEIVRIAAAKEIVEPHPAAGFVCRRAEPADAGPIAGLMAATFIDYPTPIDADTVRRQIEDRSHIFRFMTAADGSVVASASAEIDHRRGSVEMTDCATRPDQRGSGHMGYLLRRLAGDVEDDFGFTDLYTLARADEIGMNCVFAKLGYQFTGRLINNCRMPNGWESMNIWCRRTDEPAGRRGGPA